MTAQVVPLVQYGRRALGLAWFVAQMYIAYSPQLPMLERAVHVMFAVILALLWLPLGSATRAGRAGPWLDALLIAATLACTVYYVSHVSYLTERMDNVDPVLLPDKVFGLLTLLLLAETSRRVMGWGLLGFTAVFVAYAFVGPWMPGWLYFQGFKFDEFIEIMTMTGHGIFGITTQASVQLVFYFLAFSAVYTAVGGTDLFMDCALRLVGKKPGGAAKAEVVSSALFGTVSGSAVANVTVTGSFTIPLMMRTGYSREEAAAHEAIASTGGQLMPPVMGIAAFVMADILRVPYATIALAAAIPAVTYYLALYLLVHLKARRSGIGSLPAQEIDAIAAILPRIHLLTPPIALLAAFFFDYSATSAAIIGMLAAWACGYLPHGRPITFRNVLDVTDDCVRQAFSVAIPIIISGVFIAIAIQSNLAIKFSSNLLELSGGTIWGSLFFITLGVLILGTGLPTVAAYIIAAILFAPALIRLGFLELPAHFFVLFFGVLSMVTPPIALAAFTAAGIAKANPDKTGWLAFALGIPAYLIPFAFLFNPAILFIGSLFEIATAAVSLMCGTAAWTILIAGYVFGRIPRYERALYGVLSVALILAPLGIGMRLGAIVAFAVAIGFSALMQGRRDTVAGTVPTR